MNFVKNWFNKQIIALVCYYHNLINRVGITFVLHDLCYRYPKLDNNASLKFRVFEFVRILPKTKPVIIDFITVHNDGESLQFDVSIRGSEFNFTFDDTPFVTAEIFYEDGDVSTLDLSWDEMKSYICDYPYEAED